MPKTTLELVYKKEIIEKVYLLVFKTDTQLDFTPGQFFSLETDPKVYRSYSTVSYSNKAPDFYNASATLSDLENQGYLTFMISTKPGGTASVFFDNVKIGKKLTAIGPSGKFKLAENKRPKVFVATGTGLAPFVGMLEESMQKNPEISHQIYFGVWNKESDFAKNFFTKHPELKITTVIDGFKEEDLDQNNLPGKVTEVIPPALKDLTAYDFYLCGHPAMVAAMEEELLKNQVDPTNIYSEKFGK